MNFPDYLRSIWTDPRFQDLDTPTRALLYGALSQVDIAGWWAPNPRLVAVEIPGVDLKAAQERLKPWVQVHPTGWWSFKGYVALQVGDGGLKLNNGFHKGLHRVLTVHAKRERSAALEAGALPGTIEGLGASPTGGVEPSSQDEDGGASVAHARGKGGAVSPKSQVPCPKDPSLESESPTRGSGGDAPQVAQAVAGWPKVLNVFAQMAPVCVLDVKPWERDAVHKAGARWGWEAVYKAAGAYFAGGLTPLPSLGDFTKRLPRLVALECTHADREWFVQPVDKAWPKGQQYRRWRCKACRHSEAAEGSEFLLSDHQHHYTRQHGAGIVLNGDGEAVSVAAWELCGGPNGCGHQRAVHQEVAA